MAAEITLLQKHEEFISRLRANGVRILRYQVPCCGKELEDRAANKGEVWDTLATCPHCKALYLKISKSSEIVAMLAEVS
ncbi:MAG: hypothetical protein J0I77_09470 [Rudaea sp.]|uniref:hypothetical protein n=1 Tax=unclassified Rudaea TaxID=2627037 RepID=UPI0010F6547D|nr:MULTISPECIES: hypothetical protein [unclassified Rudaea]MBN8885936.1 hypothetical protein [Rudaea sp.]